jgi:hypothetical protein
VIDSSKFYVCSHILHRARPVRLVVHHSDGMWQLTCGKHDHPKDHADLHFVHIEHILEDNHKLQDVIINTPAGYLSEMNNDNWELMSHDD